MPVNIVHIIPTLNRGGAERIVVDLLKHIDRKRFSPSLITLKSSGALRDEIEAAGIPHISFTASRLGGALVVNRLARAITSLKPDIVHTHLFGADAWGIRAARKAKVPCIITTEHNVNRDESRTRRIIKSRALREVTRVIAVSPAVARFARETYGVAEDKISVIPNGIDLTHYGHDRRNDQKFRIGALGRLEEQKGFRFLIEALAMLPDRDWQCVIAGEGTQKQKLETLSRKMGVSSRVQLVGGRADVPALLATFDVLVLPSLWEGQGIVLLEAGAAGVPVIASRVDGIAEMLAGKEAALLTAPGDARGIMLALRWVREHTEAANAMAARWKRMIEKEYTIKIMVRRYEDLYENCTRK
ncbi:MAG: glycosyltransferase [bacterium]|nr:glycosyltransferase [bacterium]